MFPNLLHESAWLEWNLRYRKRSDFLFQVFPETHMGIRILKELILIPSFEGNANLQDLAGTFNKVPCYWWAKICDFYIFP